jgi:ABC-type transport system involved in multi-copper enzyme maturation permease subunit
VTVFLGAEWLKLRKRWMPRILILLMMVLLALLFWGTGTSANDRGNLLLPRGWVAALAFAGIFAPFFWPVLGGSWAGGEYGWGTIRMVLSRRPFRIGLVLSALVILLLAAAIGLIALLVAGSASGIVVAALTGNSAFNGSVFDASFAGILVKSFLATLFVCGFYLVLAYAAGAIFRSSAVGIGVGIGLTFAEFIVGRIFMGLGGKWAGLADHFPIQYTTALPERVSVSAFVPGSGMSSVGPNTPQIGESILFLAIYIAVLLAATLVVVRARDVTS